MTASVAFVTSIVAPFQVELADAIRSRSDLDYHVVFSEGIGTQRGRHWAAPLLNRPYVHSPTPQHPDRQAWSRQQLERIQPSVIVVGGYRGPGFRAASDYSKHVGPRIGFWGEPPTPRGPIQSQIRRAVRRKRLQDFDFALCIGTSAFAEYHQIVPIGNSYVVPYGQDLSKHLAIDRPRASTTPRFLFSGQLIRRHNLSALFYGLADVARERPKAFRVTIAASGPEQNLLDRCLSTRPELAEVLDYDRDYERWEDRVRPFANSDVLLYPSHHSGWGLVVPEAMAAGMLVISTLGVEAARCLITPGVDGLLVDGSRASVVRAVDWCLDHPTLVRQMGQRARQSSVRGSADYVAATLVEVLERYLPISSG